MHNELIKRILSSLVLIPLCFFFIIKGSLFFNLFLIICFILTSYEWYIMSKKKNYQLFGFFFLIVAFYTTYSLRNYFNDDSLLIFLLIIVICISTDIGGYVFGKFFGGPKLTKISPNKTYSGMLGGYLLSIIIVYIFSFFYPILFAKNVQEFSLSTLLLIIAISTASQIGDIIISYFKRLSKIKNTGNLIPGHGGILDRIDGMIFAFPFSYIIFTFDILK